MYLLVTQKLTVGIIFCLFLNKNLLNVWRGYEVEVYEAHMKAALATDSARGIFVSV